MQIKKNNLCVFRKLSWRSIIIHLTSEHLLYMEQLITRSTLQLQLIFELIISSSIASIDNHTYNIQFRIALIIYYRLFKSQLMVENIYIYILLIIILNSLHVNAIFHFCVITLKSQEI